MTSALAITPRGLSRENAAAYVGVSPVTFDKMVADGRMPQPRAINRRKVYDIRELDEHFDRLPYSGPTKSDDDEAGENNPFDTVEAI